MRMIRVDENEIRVDENEIKLKKIKMKYWTFDTH